MAKFILLNSMVNKQLYLYFFVISLACSSCGEATKDLTVLEGTKETILTDLIKSTVIVEDTSFNYFMKKDSAFVKIYRNKDSSQFKSLVKSISYLPAVEFENYKSGLMQFLKNEKAVVCSKDLSVLKDASARKNIYVLCDSIEFTDQPNKPKVFACDSTSTFMFIQGFDFYERWSIENESGNIKKEIWAYSPVKYNDVKKQFVPIFYVFKNMETFEQLKSKIKN